MQLFHDALVSFAERREICMKIMAGIVLYNPDIERLVNNFLSVAEQVDYVLIVDNGSENIDEVEKQFQLFNDCLMVKNGKNLGIAKALNQILDFANNQGYDWVLTLDQDSMPSHNMIRSFASSIDDSTVGIVCPKIKDINFSQNSNSETIEVITNPEDVITSGSLINTVIAKQIGGFDDRLFIDFVDTDFQKRMLISGHKILKDNTTCMLHEVGHMQEHRFLGHKVLCSNHSAFRRYYMVRNRLYYRSQYEDAFSLVQEKIRLILGTIKIFIYENNKLEKVIASIKGFRDYKHLLDDRTIMNNDKNKHIKVSFVLPALYGTGGINVVYEYGRRLSQRGYDVTIYAPILAYNMHRGNKCIDIAKQLYATLKVAKSIYVDKLAFRMENEKGVKVKAVKRVSNRYIQNADVVIATAWCTAFDVNRLDECKGKKVYFIQDYEVWDNEILGKKSYRLPLKQIVIAGWIKDNLVKECGCIADEIDIVNNGIDIKKFTINKTFFEDNKKQIRCLMLDHVLEKKGVRYGIEAFNKAKTIVPNIELTMFGIKKSPYVPEGIQYYENPKQDVLVKLYQESDIFIFPSLEEGWGLTPVEAMACGCAVVGTNVGCMLDIGTDNVNALICKPADVDALSKGIIKLANDDALRKRIAEAGCKTVQSLDWDVSNNKFEAILDRVIGR